MLLLISVSGCNFLYIKLRMDALLSLTQKISFQAQSYLPLRTALSRQGYYLKNPYPALDLYVR